MTDNAEKPHLRPSQQLAALLDFPEPEFTEEQERAFREWMADGDAKLQAALARRREQRAS